MLKRYYRYGTISLITGALFLVMYLTSLHSNLLFNSSVQICTVIIAASLFLFTWIIKRNLENSYWLFIGTAYLFIGILSILYVFSYDGMQIFKDYKFYGSQLFTALRYIESATLLAALYYTGKKNKIYFITLAYTIILAAVILSIFNLRAFPECFIEGEGFTIFYNISEVIALSILFSSIILLKKNKQKFEDNIYKTLFTSYILNIISGILLLSYISYYNIAFITGSYLRLLSLCFIFYGAIKIGIHKPYEAMSRELRLKEVQLEEISLVDELTGVFNRRAAFKTLDKMIKLLKRNKQNLSICYIGLDNYNEVLDSYGVEEGNIMVNMLISSLKESVRQSDYVCRLEDDEFLLILPECGTESGYVIIERVRENLTILNNDIDKPYKIDFSYGFASYNYNNTFDIDSFLRIADYNKYQNKTSKVEVEEINILYNSNI